MHVSTGTPSQGLISRAVAVRVAKTMQAS